MKNQELIQRLREACRKVRELGDTVDILLEVASGPQNDVDIDQHRSLLGARRHCGAVRRRIAEGLPGAVKIGRRYLLSPDAHAEELARIGRALPKAPPLAKARAQSPEQEALTRIQRRLKECPDV